MKIKLLICTLFISCGLDDATANLQQDNCTPSVNVFSRTIFTELTNSFKPFKFTFLNSLISHSSDCSLQNTSKLDLLIENESVDTVTMAFKIEFRQFGNPATTHFGYRLDGMDPSETRRIFTAASNFLDDLNSYEILITAHEITFANPSL